MSVLGRIVTAHILCAGCSMTCCSEHCQTLRYLSSPPVTTNEFDISVPQKTLKLHETQYNFKGYYLVTLLQNNHRYILFFKKQQIK